MTQYKSRWAKFGPEIDDDVFMMLAEMRCIRFADYGVKVGENYISMQQFDRLHAEGKVTTQYENDHMDGGRNGWILVVPRHDPA